MSLVIFEDDRSGNFYPLTYTRPCFELIYGARRIIDYLIDLLKPSSLCFRIRDHLKPLIDSKYGARDPELDGVVVFANSLLRPDKLGMLPRDGEVVVSSAGRLAFARLKGRDAEAMIEGMKPVRLADLIEIDGMLFEYPWELIDERGLRRSVAHSKLEASEPDGCLVIGPKPWLKVGRAEIEPGSVFDLRSGPVVIDDGARIESGTRVEGPAYIGKGTSLLSARIRRSAIMNNVKLGSEVDSSVIDDYTNSAHMGFIGHSYLGSWINVGAGSVTSDLKNTYGSVRVSVMGKRIDTGLVKLGSFIGDGAKLSIGSMIYCGKKVGPFSQIHGFVMEDVPPFVFYAKGLGKGSYELELESVIETQRRMMRRRGIEMDRAYELMIVRLFEITKEERRGAMA